MKCSRGGSDGPGQERSAKAQLAQNRVGRRWREKILLQTTRMRHHRVGENLEARMKSDKFGLERDLFD